MVQWLGFSAFTAVAWIQSLVGELRSHKPCSVDQKKQMPRRAVVDNVKCYQRSLKIGTGNFPIG